MPPLKVYNLRCTLTFGDIYGQVLVWISLIFLSLVTGFVLVTSSRPLFGVVGIVLILALSFPFVLFTFITTLINHIRLQSE
ncbi:putative regulator (chromatophore) [Paulinella micropora]|uniref:Regulator n=1 Tax=Paulinella micropora TaxID=1928728 RepID=A0A1L5YBD4_9EUKA|nr:hypothetical protein PMNZ_220 [Paulinella micropora]APP88015.1 hypothetical protein PCKR_220 [Paulinella micropora]AQX44782.1 hypothetical protein PFK_220 [Paulinella micropora]AXY63173.1 hypothetical protein PMNZ_220 [Paulinella micropora]BBL85995.1 putative regulator [Paulinella micropora]